MRFNPIMAQIMQLAVEGGFDYNKFNPKPSTHAECKAARSTDDILERMDKQKAKLARRAKAAGHGR